MLTRFVGSAGKAFTAGGALHQVFAGIFRTLRMGLPILGGFIGMIGGAFLSAMGKVTSVFTDAIKETLGFELSIKGLLDQAEKARKYYSELSDELSYISDKTGSTAVATNILMQAQAKSAASMGQLKSSMQGLVDAGVEDMAMIRELLPVIGDLEVATGVAGTQFSQMMGKFSEIFKKKGIQKDILLLTKAMVGTGLRTQNLEQALQGVLEISEKLAFVTRGQTLDFVNLGKEYSRATAVFKSFGISAQNTQSFISGLMDPENIDKHMLLLNKLGYSYEEFNQMLNTGKGQEVFFDKVLNNIGQVASEANMIEDAATRYKYLKETLGLPPEFANKLLNIEPYRVREEIKRLKKEQEEAEKRAKIKEKLKQREEKYQEQLDFIRFNMVAPLMDFIIKNRKTMMDMMKALTPVIQGLSKMLNDFLVPFTNWFSDFNKDLTELNKTIGGLNEKDKAEKIRQFIVKQVQTFADTFVFAFTAVWNSDQVQGVIIPIAQALGRLLRIAMKYAAGNVIGKRTWEEASNLIDYEQLSDNPSSEKNKKFMEGKGGWYKRGLAENKLALSSAYAESGDTKKAKDTFELFLRESNQLIDESIDNELIEKTNRIKELSSIDKGGYFANKKEIDRIQNEINNMEKKREIERSKFLDAIYEDYGEVIKTMGLQYRFGNRAIKTNNFKIEPPERFYDGPGHPLDKDKKQNYSPNKNQTPIVGSGGSGGVIPRSTFFKNPPMEQQPNQSFAYPGIPSPGGYSNKPFETLNESNDPFLKLLKEFKVGVLGETSKNNSAMSIKELLFDISENLSDTDNSKDNKNKLSFNQANANITKEASTPSNNELMPSIGISGYAESTALKQIANSSVKNLSVRQTLYLKAIAEATFSTAYHIKNIASGLIFTKYGLATYDQAVTDRMPAASSWSGYKNVSSTGIPTQFNPLGITGGSGRNITASGTLLGN